MRILTNAVLALSLAACGGPMGSPDAGDGDAGGDGGTGSDASRPSRDGGPAGECAPPPASASAAAVAAYNRLNEVRAAMGTPCASMNEAINTAARAHCEYYVANRADSMCVANAHREVMSCAMFTGATFADRMRAAGYMGSPAFEVMHFLSPENGAGAVQGWIDSIWHRSPVLSPWVREFGYGGIAGCQTIDFGRGANLLAATEVRTYPYDGQTEVPVSFNGREGPPPPPPPTGWPSGYPITVYLQGMITEHTLTVDGDATPIEHVWLEPGGAMSMGLLSREFFLYAHRPLAAATRYRVHVVGTNMAGPVDLSWTFTTR